MLDQSIIHKQLLDVSSKPQTLAVPADATLVAIHQDTRELEKIGVWYRFTRPSPDYAGASYLKDWTFFVAATGIPFPATHGTVLTTAFMGEFAWHVIDVNNTVTPRGT
jgi:hypothetical protein